MVDFRRVFARTLRQVKAVYNDARVSLDPQGMRLANSPPPVARRVAHQQNLKGRRIAIVILGNSARPMVHQAYKT